VVRKYILPCAGYDRPGGEVTRVAVERLTKDRDNVVIGSMGALFMERPGEMRDYRTSDVLCLDGCGTNCATGLTRARGRDDATSLSIPEIAGSVEDFEDKVRLTVDAIAKELDKSTPKTSPTAIPELSRDIEFMEEKFDKFTLKVGKGLKYSDNDFWVRTEGEYVRIGASDFLQQMMSDVYFVGLAEPETHVDMFDDAGAMESTKIMVEIIVPVSGTIVESNVSLEDSPEFINESPYGKGWLYLIKPDDIAELELLRDASDYMVHVLAKAKEEIGKKVK
jgi:glycine cleavage system H protein